MTSDGIRSPAAIPEPPAAREGRKRPQTARRGVAGAHVSWQKSHPLEGDGLLCLFYQYLFKKNKSFLSCPNVKIPDTIVYEHNFPRAWYTYDFKNAEIQKRQGRFLDTQHILNVFSKLDKGGSGCDICAQYLFTQENDVGQQTTSVEFLRPPELEHFLNQRKSRPDGILQKFPPPRSGAVSNTQIQVVWSPRVTLIQRRVNKYRLNDKSIPAYDRAVTYDGPAHFSSEGLCSSRTKDEILDICASIVDHFASTEHKAISRLVCYFKVSPVPAHSVVAGESRDAIWLLWASSLRVGTAKAHITPTRPRLPLDLCPNFAAPDVQGMTEQKPKGGHAGDEDVGTLIKSLAMLDDKQFDLSGDLMFRRMCARPGTARVRGRAAAPAAAAGTKLPRPRTMRRLISQARRTDGSGGKRFSGGRGSCSTAVDLDELDSSGTPWWTVSREIWIRRKGMLQGHRCAQLFADDTVYLIYSHMLRREQKNEGPFVCKVPRQVAEFIGPDWVPMLMEGVFGLSFREGTCPGTLLDDEQDGEVAVPVLPNPGETTVAGDRWELVEIVDRPYAQQSAEARRFLSDVLDRRMHMLRSAAAEVSPSHRVHPRTGRLLSLDELGHMPSRSATNAAVRGASRFPRGKTTALGSEEDLAL